MELWCSSTFRGHDAKEQTTENEKEWPASWREFRNIRCPKSLVKKTLRKEEILYIVKSFLETKKMRIEL